MAWKVPGADSTVRVTDKNGNHLSDTVTRGGNRRRVQSIETSTLWAAGDKASDGTDTTGPPDRLQRLPAVIERFGSTSLTEIGTHFYLYGSGGTGPSLKYRARTCGRSIWRSSADWRGADGERV